MKFIIFWLLFGSLLAGGARAWLARRGRKDVALAAAAGLVLGASCALDLYRALDRIKVASWVACTPTLTPSSPRPVCLPSRSWP
jgi:hypothetical protein